MMILFILALISLIVVVGFVVKNRREAHGNGHRFRGYYLGVYPDTPLSKPVMTSLELHPAERFISIQHQNVLLSEIVDLQVVKKPDLQKEIGIDLGLFARAFKKEAAFLVVFFRKEDETVSKILIMQTNEAVLLRRMLMRDMKENKVIPFRRRQKNES